MKILNTASDFFYYDLKNIIQKRSQYNLPSVDDSVKSIIKEVDKIMDIQSKLIVNISAYKTKTKKIESIINQINKIIS